MAIYLAANMTYSQLLVSMYTYLLKISTLVLPHFKVISVGESKLIAVADRSVLSIPCVYYYHDNN